MCHDDVKTPTKDAVLVSLSSSSLSLFCLHHYSYFLWLLEMIGQQQVERLPLSEEDGWSGKASVGVVLLVLPPRGLFHGHTSNMHRNWYEGQPGACPGFCRRLRVKAPFYVGLIDYCVE